MDEAEGEQQKKFCGLRARLGQQAQHDAFAHYTWEQRAHTILNHVRR